MKIFYTIDNINQPIYVSKDISFVGETVSATIPWFSKNIVVSGEGLGFSWYTIFTDSNINTAQYCTKCYKVWGDVSNPRWDYIAC